MTYDSRPDTWAHIHQVRKLLRKVIFELMHRAEEHDQTKLEEPELSLFNEFTPKLRSSTHGSAEYEGFRKSMGKALDHHYASYRHHPEHFPNGIADMNLIDLIEMLADWKAATMRHDDGDLGRSIYKVGQERFGYSDEMRDLLERTARDLGWL
jgi:hypothetical protein